MADEKKPARVRGRFAPGTSGNPGGKPKTDSAKPARTPTRRHDGWVNFFTGLGVYGQDKRQGASFYSQQLNFTELLELWRGDDLAARAVETLPREATREGWDLVLPENEDGSDESELIAAVMDKVKVLGVNSIIRQALGTERGMGGSAVLIGANDGQRDLTKPLDLSKVRSIDWLTHLEPREIVPVYGYADPRAPKYGQPEIYRLTSRAVLPPAGGAYAQTLMEVHESRLLVFPGIRVSRYQQMASQGGWGDSVLNRMWRVLRDFNSAWGSAGVLVTEFAKAVYKMKDLWEVMSAADGPAAFAERLQAMQLAQSTINATVIDADDDYSREQTPLAGLPDLMDKFATRLAAAADMPITLLFGTSPGGLNATGESDIRFFYDRVAAFQRDKILPQLEQILRIIFRTMGNRQEPAKWSVKFKPLWQESAADKAKAMLTSAQADAIWIQNSVISAEETAKSHWGSGEWSPDIKVDFDARERQEQAAASPVVPEDLLALGRDVPGYTPPPGQGSFRPAPDTTPPGPPAAPDPNTPPKPIVQADAADQANRYDDFNPDEPRDPDGKWAGGGAGSAGQLAERAKEQGGFTYDPRTGGMPTKGYAVSIHPGHEFKLAGKDAMDASHVKAYLDEREQFFKNNPGSHVGGWYNPDDDTWYLDVSHVEPSLDKAVQLGQEHHQLGIYDLKRGETISADQYQDALARRGKFSGRTDASPWRSSRDVRPQEGHRRGDGGRDGQGAPRGAGQARPAGVARGRERWDDWDESQHPRDESGKFSESGGGSAKPKESLGTVGKMREAVGPKALNEKSTAERQKIEASAQARRNAEMARANAAGYKPGEEEAKARAAVEAGKQEYRQQARAIASERYRAPQPGDLGWQTAEQRIRAMENAAAEARMRTHEGVGQYDPSNQNKYGFDPDADWRKPPEVLPGQRPLLGYSGMEPKDEDRDLHERVAEALKNNARQGESGRPPSEVVREVHERVGKEREEKAAAERARVEREEKARVEREEKAQRLKEAADYRAEAERKQKEAEDKVAGLRGSLAEARANRDFPPAEMKARKLEGELGKAEKQLAHVSDLAEKAKAAHEALKPKDSLSRMSTDEERKDLAGRQIAQLKTLGGGVSASYVATLDDGSKAVWKSGDYDVEHAPEVENGSNLRDGIEAGTYYEHNAAYSTVAGILGVEDLVPATVIHNPTGSPAADEDGGNHEGSLMAWQPDAKSPSYGTMFDQDGAERMRAADFIMGQTDRHQKNIMARELPDGRIMPVMIDNDLCLPKSDKFGEYAGVDRFIQPADYIPQERLLDSTERMINKIDHVKLASTLASAGIDREAIHGAVARAQALKRAPEMIDGEDHGYDSYHWDRAAGLIDSEDSAHADEIMKHPDVVKALRKGRS